MWAFAIGLIALVGLAFQYWRGVLVLIVCGLILNAILPDPHRESRHQEHEFALDYWKGQVSDDFCAGRQGKSAKLCSCATRNYFYALPEAKAEDMRDKHAPLTIGRVQLGNLIEECRAYVE